MNTLPLGSRCAAHGNFADLLAFVVYNRNVSLRVHVD
jgi:hypothetical protein